MVSPIQIDKTRLLSDIESLAAIGPHENGGLYRKAFSPAYEEAVCWLSQRMKTAGLTVRRDPAGNLIGRLGPSHGPAVLAGSHIDTVPGGGPLDGAYGVLAALESARCLAALSPDSFQRAYEVVAFVDEEGAYATLMGSRAMAGLISAAEVDQARDTQGKSLKEAMAEAQLDSRQIVQACRPAEEIAAYLELHIEQGPVLENEDLQIGVVEGIVGILPKEFRFKGQANHAGTTPMASRQDALKAAARFITEAYDQQIPLLGERGRMTFGALDLQPNASNVVPEELRLRLDLRHLSTDELSRVSEACNEIAKAVAARENVALTIHELGRDDPAAMAPFVRDIIATCAKDLDCRAKTMPSGAGHDAQIMAKLAPTGMIFVPSKAGASHRADEWTDPEDLERGTNLLCASLQKLLTCEELP